MKQVNLIKPNGFKSIALYIAQETIYWFLNGQREPLESKVQACMPKHSLASFPLTPDGCAAAKAWLEKTGNFDKLEKEASTDGYTLVQLANNLQKAH